MEKGGYTYIVTNPSHTVLYIGVSNSLDRRARQHRNHVIKGFTHRYNCEKLVYFEHYNEIEEAIRREKQLKGWRRDWKNNLISGMNPEWKDLFECPEVLEEAQNREYMENVENMENHPCPMNSSEQTDSKDSGSSPE